VETRLRHLVR